MSEHNELLTPIRIAIIKKMKKKITNVGKGATKGNY